MSADDDAPPADWPKHASEHGANLLLFQPRWDLRTNPRTGERMRRLVLETADWVNVVARTKDGDFVLVRQFRFGTEHVTLEIPGGVIDPGEAPRVAAERELREETGYTSDDWVCLGSVEPNPAFHDNRCHHYLARGARRTAEQELDAGEDVSVCLLGAQALRAAVASGEVDHALVISALCRVLDLRGS